MGSVGQRFFTGYSVVAAISLLLAGAVGYFYWQDNHRTRQINRELAVMQQEVVSLQTRKVELEDLLKYFDSESYAESRARLELGLVRPGEKVLVVPPALGTSKGVGQETPGNEPSERRTPLKAWWSFFFSHRAPEYS